MFRITLKIGRFTNLCINRFCSSSTDKDFFLGLAKHTIKNRDETKQLNYDDFIDRVNQEKFENHSTDNDKDVITDEGQHETFLNDNHTKSSLINDNFNLSSDYIKNIIDDKSGKVITESYEKFTSNIEGTDELRDKSELEDFKFKDYVEMKTKKSYNVIGSPIKIKNILEDTEKKFKATDKSKTKVNDYEHNNKKKLKKDSKHNDNRTTLKNGVINNAITGDFDPTDSAVIKETVTNLLKFGVDLYRDESDRVRGVLIKLDWEKDIFPIISFLKTNTNLNDKEIADILSRDCRFFKRTLQEIEDTLTVLKSRGISPSDVGYIVKTKPGILCVDKDEFMKNLKNLETAIMLTTTEVNSIICTHPKITVMRWTLLKNMLVHLKNNLGFSSEEIRDMIIKHPNILIKEKQVISENYIFLHRTLQLSYQEIAECAEALLAKPSVLSARIRYLKYLELYQCDNTKDSYTAISKIINYSDKDFCEQMTHTGLNHFQAFMHRKK